MPSPVKVVFNADTGQFVASVDGATQSVAKQAEAVASAKNRIVAAFKEQADAAKANGATAEDLARIQTKAAESLANVSEKNASRVISALDRITDKQKRVAAELQALGDMPVPEPKSHGSEITDRMRASALLRGGGLRAGENYASQFELFNKISTIAFPVLGLATLGAEAIKAVAALKEMYDTAEKLPKVLDAGFGSINLSMRTANDALDTTNAKLEAAHDKFAGKPENNLKVAIAEAREEADKFAQSLANDTKAVNELLSQNKLSGLYALMGKGGTASIDSSIQSYMNKLQELGNQASEAMGRGDTAGAAAKRREAQETQKSGLAWAKSKLFLLDNPQYATQDDDILKGADNSANRSTVLGFQGVMLNQQHRDQSESTNLGDRQQAAADEAKKAADEKRKKDAEAAKAAAEKRKEAARKAAEDQRNQWDEEHDALVNAGKQSAGDDFDFWTLKVYSIQVGSANYKAALDKQTAALAELRKSDLEAAEKADAAAQKAQSSSWDTMHGEWVAAGHRTAEDERLFWELRTLEAVEGSENYRKAYDHAIAATVAAQKEAEEADKARSKASLEKGQQQTSMAEAILGIQVMTGEISRQDAAVQQANIHAEQYRQKMAALGLELARQKSLDPDSAGTVNAQAALDQADADRKVQIMQDAAKTAAESWQGALRNANALWVQDSQDSARQVVALYQSAIDGVNQNIVSFLTSKHGHGRHTTDWKGLGRNLAKEGTGDLLKQAEGSVMKGLGLAKADGSRGNPLHVLVDNPGGLGGGASGISSMFRSKSGGDDDSDGPSNGFASIAGTLLGSLFGGHRALGGGVKAGVTYDVGEMGREEFTPSADGYITPTNRIGNGAASYTVNVANGVTPEQMKMHVRQALSEFHPVVVASSVAAVRSDRSRNPATRN